LPGRFALALSPNGRWAATVRGPPPPVDDLLATGQPQPPVEDAVVRLWDLTEGKAGPVLRGHKGAATALAFNDDGRFLATAGEDRVVHLWDVATGAEKQRLEGHADPVRHLRQPGLRPRRRHGEAAGPRAHPSRPHRRRARAGIAVQQRGRRLLAPGPPADRPGDRQGG